MKILIGVNKIGFTNNFMFGFSKHCPICGMDVKKENGIKRFGKYFCSNGCVEKYLQKKAIEEQRKPRRSGCY